jgi:hypothetical protein
MAAPTRLSANKHKRPCIYSQHLSIYSFLNPLDPRPKCSGKGFMTAALSPQNVQRHMPCLETSGFFKMLRQKLVSLLLYTALSFSLSKYLGLPPIGVCALSFSKIDNAPQPCPCAVRRPSEVNTKNCLVSSLRTLSFTLLKTLCWSSYDGASLCLSQTCPKN